MTLAPTIVHSMPAWKSLHQEGRSPHYTRCPAHLNTVPMLTSMEAARADSTAFWVTCSASVRRRQERALTQHTVQRLVPGRHRDAAWRSAEVRGCKESGVCK